VPANIEMQLLKEIPGLQIQNTLEIPDDKSSKLLCQFCFAKR
jgi:hypothetical protein